MKPVFLFSHSASITHKIYDFPPFLLSVRRFIFLLLPLPLCQGHHLLEVTGSSLLFLTFNLLFPLSAKLILPLTPSFLLSLFSVTHMHPPPDPVSSNLYIKPEDLHAAGKKKDIQLRSLLKTLNISDAAVVPPL